MPFQEGNLCCGHNSILNWFNFPTKSEVSIDWNYWYSYKWVKTGEWVFRIPVWIRMRSNFGEQVDFFMSVPLLRLDVEFKKKKKQGLIYCEIQKNKRSTSLQFNSLRAYARRHNWRCHRMTIFSLDVWADYEIIFWDVWVLEFRQHISWSKSNNECRIHSAGFISQTIDDIRIHFHSSVQIGAASFRFSGIQKSGVYGVKYPLIVPNYTTCFFSLLECNCTLHTKTKFQQSNRYNFVAIILRKIIAIAFISK